MVVKEQRHIAGKDVRAVVYYREVLITQLKLRITPFPCVQWGGEGVDTGVKKFSVKPKFVGKARQCVLGKEGQ